MFQKSFLPALVLGLLTSCQFQNREADSLKAQIASLKSELEANNHAAQTLQVIWSLIDSIDMNRNALKTRMIEGTTMEDYNARMRSIADYVAQTEKKISSLESNITLAKNSLASYVGTAKKMRSDLEIRYNELAVLQGQMDQYHNQNVNLVQTVDLQKAEIIDNLEQIDTRQQEIATLEIKVKDLLVNNHAAEAEAYLKRARAVEEIANRTRFAPKKKKETRKEALELYKMAASYGSEEAKVKVTQLETQI